MTSTFPNLLWPLHGPLGSYHTVLYFAGVLLLTGGPGLGVGFELPRCRVLMARLVSGSFSEVAVSCYSGSPLGFHPFSSLSFAPLSGWCLTYDRILARWAAPVVFCGRLAVAWLGWALVSLIWVLSLVPGISPGYSPCIVYLPRGILVSRVASPCAGEEGGVALWLSRLSCGSSVPYVPRHVRPCAD